jgi:hypothetical protein
MSVATQAVKQVEREINTLQEENKRLKIKSANQSVVISNQDQKISELDRQLSNVSGQRFVAESKVSTLATAVVNAFCANLGADWTSANIREKLTPALLGMYDALRDADRLAIGMALDEAEANRNEPPREQGMGCPSNNGWHHLVDYKSERKIGHYLNEYTCPDCKQVFQLDSSD